MKKCDELIEKGFSNIKDKNFWEKLYNECIVFLSDKDNSQEDKEKLLTTNMETITMMYKSFI